MGDREPVLGAAIEALAEPLITPHGDREPGKDYRAIRDAISISLPLMGIGNPKQLGRWNEQHPWISLPLMGIGNARVLRAMRFSYRDSLPLMGIGNFLVAIAEPS